MPDDFDAGVGDLPQWAAEELSDLPDDPAERQAIVEAVTSKLREEGFSGQLDMGGPPAPPAPPEGAGDGAGGAGGAGGGSMGAAAPRPNAFQRATGAKKADDFVGPPLPPRRELPTSVEPTTPPSLSDRLTPYWYEPGRMEGEATDAYERRSDVAWQTEMQKAGREGSPRVRHSKLPMGVEKVMSAIPAYAGSLAMGMSRGLDLGIPDRLAGLANPEARDNVDRMTSGGVELPLLQELRGATEILSMFQPGSASSRIGKAVGGAAKSPITRMGAGVVGSAADQAARKVVDRTANALEGRENVPLSEDLKDVGEAGLYGAVASPFFEAARVAGSAAVNSARSNPTTGSQMVNAEAAGAKTKSFRPMSGLEPPYEVAEARRLQAMPRPPQKEIAANPERDYEGSPALNITTSKTTNKLHEAVRELRERVPKEIRAEKVPYLGSPEAQELVSIEPAIEAVQARMSRYFDANGRQIPGYSDAEFAADKKLLGKLLDARLVEEGGEASELSPGEPLTVKAAREFGLPIDETALSERAAENVSNEIIVTNPRTQTVAAGKRPMTAVLPPAQGAPNEMTVQQARNNAYGLDEGKLQDRALDKLETDAHVEVQPRTMTAQQLEDAIDLYQEARGNAPNTRTYGTQTEDVILAKLMELRGQFKANEHAPEETGGWKGMTERHAQKMQDLEDLFGALGERRRINALSKEDRTYYEPLANVARTWAQKGTTSLNSYKAFRELVANNPEVEHWLRASAGHRDLEALESGTRMPVYVGESSSGPHARIGMAGQAARWVGRHLDPLAQRAAGESRGGPEARVLPEPGVGKGRGGQVSPPPDPDSKAFQAGRRVGRHLPSKAREWAAADAPEHSVASRAARTGSVAEVVDQKRRKSAHDDKRDDRRVSERLAQWTMMWLKEQGLVPDE